VKIAFVNPPTKYAVEPRVYPPVGLGYLAAAVNTRTKHVAEVLDLAGHSIEEAAERIILGAYDIVGFTASSTYWADMLSTAAYVARFQPLVQLIVGGPHVTITRARPDLFRAVFYGSADASIVTWLDDGQPYGSFESIPMGVDELPIPEAPLAKGVNSFDGGQTAIIYSGFGCTHMCSFCAARAMFGRLQFRSVPHVMAEVDHYIARGVSHIRFMDDAFTMGRRRTLELCEALKDRAVDWGCMARVDQVDMNLLNVMKASGCVNIAYGIESFDDKVLKLLDKGALASRNSEAIKLTYEAGIPCTAFIMVGTPGETEYTIAENLDVLDYHSRRITKILLQTFMPVPGCAIWEDPEKYGIQIVDRDYSKYNAHQWMPGPDGPMETPIWSPIRIDGLTYEQQCLNHRRMRDFAAGHTNKGVYS